MPRKEVISRCYISALLSPIQEFRISPTYSFNNNSGLLPGPGLNTETDWHRDWLSHHHLNDSGSKKVLERSDSPSSIKSSGSIRSKVYISVNGTAAPDSEPWVSIFWIFRSHNQISKCSIDLLPAGLPVYKLNKTGLQPVSRLALNGGLPLGCSLERYKSVLFDVS